MVMIRHWTGLFISFAATCLLHAQMAPSAMKSNWFQWRGEFNTGVAPAGNPPIEWGEGQHVKWKTETPGVGHATPIIRGDQIILLAAVPTDQKADIPEPSGEEENQWMAPASTEYIHRFVVMSLNRNSGEIQWQTTVREELPFSSTHQFGSWASGSPVTDGEHIYAYFGSHGLYCLDFQGNIRWEKDFGRMEKVMSFGEGSSPVVSGESLIILRDHQGASNLVVMDKRTGDISWEADREEISSWSTPLVVEVDGRSQVITSATNKVRSYDLATGEVVWECTGMTRNVIPSPMYADGIVYVMSGFRGNALMAIDLAKAKGDITGSDAIIFTFDQNTPYTPGPVLMDDRLYFLKANNGYLTCLDAKDGTTYYTSEKLDGINEIFTSPLGVKDRLYIIGTNGTGVVAKHGDQFEVLAQNQLEDRFFASPVVIGNELYLRGERYIYCISE
jgi:outer membrane protein assembly factor BamB